MLPAPWRAPRASSREAVREVGDALVAFERLSQQRQASLKVVTANRERLRLTRVRYLEGISSFFEVLDSERQFFDSELALAQTTRATHLAVVQLYRALGGGWDGQIRDASFDPARP
jgi:multidrug efflux system outer membrane protein